MLAALALAAAPMLLAGTVYHFVFLKAAREGWPVVSPLVRLIVRDEIAQRDRFMRDNLDAIARKVGEMQAKLLKLEAMGERVSGLAGVKVDELRPAGAAASTATGGRGGPFVPIDRPSLEQLQVLVGGLDFPALSGTPIRAAAGGMVVAREWHPEYGHVLEIDHGNGLVTRYAHCSEIAVALGALIKRGQVVARVGTSGRSTGAHVHFEVLVLGVPQDPARFLAGAPPPQLEVAARPTRRH